LRGSPEGWGSSPGGSGRRLAPCRFDAEPGSGDMGRLGVEEKGKKDEIEIETLPGGWAGRAAGPPGRGSGSCRKAGTDPRSVGSGHSREPGGTLASALLLRRREFLSQNFANITSNSGFLKVVEENAFQ
jgi:hypothetical protein